MVEDVRVRPGVLAAVSPCTTSNTAAALLALLTLWLLISAFISRA